VDGQRSRRYSGGGGGAGGYRTSFPGGSKLTVPSSPVPVTVGGGGAGGAASWTIRITN
jgi:hypothetical protein